MENQDVIYKFIDIVESLAPQLWAMMIKQVYVTAIGYMFASMILIIMFIAFLLWYRKNPHTVWDDSEMSPIFVSIGGLVSGAIFPVCAFQAFARFSNPGYYALLELAWLVN